MNREDIKNIINNCAGQGYGDIKVSDIAFYVLNKEFADAEVAYKVIFDTNADMEDIIAYYESDRAEAVRRAISKVLISTHEPSELDFSLEDNRDEMIKLLQDIDEALEREEIEVKDALKMKADIRTKLNDKFSIGETTVEQRVIVNSKYNFICPHTRKECYVATKDDLIKDYGLVDRKELEKKYNLIPKEQ